VIPSSPNAVAQALLADLLALPTILAIVRPRMPTA
jgi:hypothetical protein